MRFRAWSIRYIHWFGIASVMLIVGGAVIAAIGFNVHGDSYSFLKYNISKLGSPHRSPWAPVFNTALMIGGPLMALFVAGVGSIVGGRLFQFIAWIGVVASLATGFIGVYPSGPGSFAGHIVAALFCFHGTMALGYAFSVWIFSSNQTILPKWLMWPALSSCVFALLFILSVPLHYLRIAPRWLMQPTTAGGDTILRWVSTFEWLVLFSILSWVLMTALVLYKRQLEGAFTPAPELVEAYSEAE